MEVGYLNPSAVVLVVVEEIVPVDGLEHGTFFDGILNLFVPLLKLLHDLILFQTTITLGCIIKRFFSAELHVILAASYDGLR